MIRCISLHLSHDDYATHTFVTGNTKPLCHRSKLCYRSHLLTLVSCNHTFWCHFVANSLILRDEISPPPPPHSRSPKCGLIPSTKAGTIAQLTAGTYSTPQPLPAWGECPYVVRAARKHQLVVWTRLIAGDVRHGCLDDCFIIVGFLPLNLIHPTAPRSL